MTIRIGLLALCLLAAGGVAAPPGPNPPSLLPADDTGPSASDHVTSNNQPRFTGTAMPGAQVRLFANGVLAGSGVFADAGTGAYTLLAHTMLDGTYSVTVDQYDGTFSPQSTAMAPALVVDTLPPAVPPAPGLFTADDTGVSSSDHITKNPGPRFTGTGEAGATVLVLFNGVVKGSSPVVAGSYTVQPDFGQPDGTYNVTVQARDLAGNVSGSSGPLSPLLTIDTTPPMMSGYTITPTAGFVFTGTVGGFSDPDDIGGNPASYTATIDWGDSTVLPGSVVYATGPFYFVQGSHTYADGCQRTITVTASDLAGNSASIGSTAKLDHTLPAVTAPATVTIAQTLCN